MQVQDVSYALASLKCNFTARDVGQCCDLRYYGRGIFTSTAAVASSTLSTLPAPATAPAATATATTTATANTTTKTSAAAGAAGGLDVTAFSAKIFKLKTILHILSGLCPQLGSIDGFRNVWVVKAPDSSCGIGIKLQSQLDEILQSERGTVQHCDGSVVFALGVGCSAATFFYCFLVLYKHRLFANNTVCWSRWSDLYFCLLSM
jgi:hypothetical protein